MREKASVAEVGSLIGAIELLMIDLRHDPWVTGLSSWTTESIRRVQQVLDEIQVAP